MKYLIKPETKNVHIIVQQLQQTIFINRNCFGVCRKHARISHGVRVQRGLLAMLSRNVARNDTCIMYLKVHADRKF